MSKKKRDSNKKGRHHWVSTTQASPPAPVPLCDAMKSHIIELSGFDVSFLKSHLIDCDTCKQIKNIVEACMDFMTVDLHIDVGDLE